MPDAGHHRSERPDDGNEPGDDDGLRAVSLVELPGPLHVRGPEEERLLAREDPRSGAVANGVPDAVADHGRDDEQPVEPPDVEGAGGGHETGRDQQRIARQEEPDQQPRLGEDDGDQDDVTAPADEIVERIGTAGDVIDDGPRRAQPLGQDVQRPLLAPGHGSHGGL